MDKALAIAAFKTNGALADAIGVTPAAVSKWPDPLPRRIADRVLAAVARRELPRERLAALGVNVPTPTATEEAADA